MNKRLRENIEEPSKLTMSSHHGWNDWRSINFPRLQSHGRRQMDELRSHDHLLSIHWHSFLQLFVPGSPGHHIYCFPWAKSWEAWLKQSQATCFTSGPCSLSPLPPWPAFCQAFITLRIITPNYYQTPKYSFLAVSVSWNLVLWILQLTHTISYCALSSGNLGMVTLGPK